MRDFCAGFAHAADVAGASRRAIEAKMNAAKRKIRTAVPRHASAALIALLATAIAGAAQIPSVGLRSGLPDKATLNYVARCLGQAPPHPIQLYSRGGWYVTEDLRQQLSERQGDIEGVAMV